MGRVDHFVDALVLEIGDKSLNAAKTANARRQIVSERRACAPSKRNYAFQARLFGHSLSKTARLAGSAKNEDAQVEQPQNVAEDSSSCTVVVIGCDWRSLFTVRR